MSGSSPPTAQDLTDFLAQIEVAKQNAADADAALATAQANSAAARASLNKLISNARTVFNVIVS
jgi:formiminotetrahydrofolate cyclodeaminase